MPRLKQAAASFVVELGNGDKFIFDMGTGSMLWIYALGIPLDYIDKVFQETSSTSTAPSPALSQSTLPAPAWLRPTS